MWVTLWASAGPPVRKIPPSAGAAEGGPCPHTCPATLGLQACWGWGGSAVGKSGYHSSSDSFKGEWFCLQILIIIKYDLSSWRDFQAKSTSIGGQLSMLSSYLQSQFNMWSYTRRLTFSMRRSYWGQRCYYRSKTSNWDGNSDIYVRTVWKNCPCCLHRSGQENMSSGNDKNNFLNK